MRKFGGILWLFAASMPLAQSQTVAEDVGPAAPAAATPQPPTVPLPDVDLQSRVRDAARLEQQLPVPMVQRASGFEISPERQERLRKFLPRSFALLRQREPLHILALGDSAFDVAREETTPPMPAFPAAFARELADDFFYTGGVFQIGSAGSEQHLLGPAIGVRQLTRMGGSVLDAAPILESVARQARVDLVLLCYGHGAAAVGITPATFAKAVHAAVASARSLGADVVLCAPWLQVGEQSEKVLGAARPIADSLREVARQEEVIFADMGDLSWLNLPPLDAGDESRTFEVLEKTYRGFFLGDAAGLYTPRASLHAELGSLLFQQVLDGQAPAPWRIKGGAASLVGPDRLALLFDVENSTDRPLNITVLPLIAGGWRPLEATPTLSLQPHSRQRLEVRYALIQPPYGLPAGESLVRLPVLFAAGSDARVEDVRAPLQPLAVVWSLETLFNQEGAFTAACKLVNNSGREVSGRWQAEFSGKRLEGEYRIKPGAAFPIDLRHQLPREGAAIEVLPLKLSVVGNSGEPEMAVRRNVEVVRNLGLTQNIALRPVISGQTTTEVSLQATADARQLTLTCTLTGGEPLVDTITGGSPAWQLEANVDGRSYGKRLTSGATATLRATGAAADGPGRVHSVPAWAFGTGYAADFESQQFRAALTTAPDGSRKISFSIPRSYLYLHEWALDNGNSQVGLSVRLTFRHAAAGGTPSFTTYALSLSPKPPDDVEALSVLELTPTPTKRATVTVY